jgi:hypothetical protein
VNSALKSVPNNSRLGVEPRRALAPCSRGHVRRARRARLDTDAITLARPA